MSKMSRKDFEAELRWFAGQQESYLEDQQEHRARGHRSPYCFHGTSMWVDYDPMCNGCESGHPNEHTTPEEARKYFQEYYEVDYDGDDVLGKFEPIAWGSERVEVVRIECYDSFVVKNEFNNICDPMVICTVALESDGTEVEMALGTEDLILTKEALV